MKALTKTDFILPETVSVYHGKVRDVYCKEDIMVMVTSDRVSAFDVILPEGIPYKGQILNQIAESFLDATSDIIPNWKISVPHPSVMVGHKCEPFKVEMVIRGYLSGHAWREYREGKRELCGVTLPEGLVENQRLHEPVITPTTKASEGHDMDISREEIISRNIVSEEDYILLEDYTRKLFARGSEMAAQKGLILVDTKYEFGKRNGQITLMDEIHTPDSSRYFYADSYEERLILGQKQRHLSKEFVREWLMASGFMGQAGQKIPEMTPEVVESFQNRYIELYNILMGKDFVPVDTDADEIRDRVLACLKQY